MTNDVVVSLGVEKLSWFASRRPPAVGGWCSYWDGGHGCHLTVAMLSVEFSLFHSTNGYLPSYLLFLFLHLYLNCYDNDARDCDNRLLPLTIPRETMCMSVRVSL